MTVLPIWMPAATTILSARCFLQEKEDWTHTQKESDLSDDPMVSFIDTDAPDDKSD
jgi:hypothetical protein